MQQSSPSCKWRVGQHCQAVYSEDGEVYEALILSVHPEDGKCVVRYLGYENEEEQLLSDLLPLSSNNFAEASSEVRFSSTWDFFDFPGEFIRGLYSGLTSDKGLNIMYSWKQSIFFSTTLTHGQSSYTWNSSELRTIEETQWWWVWFQQATAWPQILTPQSLKLPSFQEIKYLRNLQNANLFLPEWRHGMERTEITQKPQEEWSAFWHATNVSSNCGTIPVFLDSALLQCLVCFTGVHAFPDDVINAKLSSNECRFCSFFFFFFCNFVLIVLQCCLFWGTKMKTNIVL